MGNERPYGDAVIALIDGRPVARPNPGGGTQGSPNHKFLWRCWYYGWAVLRGQGKPAERQEARGLLLDFFREQRRYGHYTASRGRADEALTCSHYWMWGLSGAAARIFALRKKDAELLRETALWWQGEFALWDLLSTPRGEIKGPSARSGKGQEINRVRDVVYQLGRKLPLTTPGARKPNGPWWQGRPSSPAWAVRILLEKMKDDLGGIRSVGRADLPRLAQPMHVLRSDDGHQAWFDFFPVLKPRYWASADYTTGKATFSPPVEGRGGVNPFPLPDVPWRDAAQEVIVPGVEAFAESGEQTATS